MAKLKKFIVILIIMLIFTVAIIGYLIYKNKWKPINEVNEHPVESTYVYNSTIQEISVRNDYYAVKSCINKFYVYYSKIYNIDDYLIEDDEIVENNQKTQSIEAVYNMLDEEYIDYNNITKNNLTTKLPQVGKMSIIIDDMYVSEKDNNISVYFAYGKLIDTTTSQPKDFSIMVKVDRLSRTFTVLLGDFIDEKFGDIDVGKKLEINYPEKIEKNDYNTYDYKIIKDDTYIGDIFKSFRDNMIYDKQAAYEQLNEEYRNKRFPTLKDFEKYINDNTRKISTMNLSHYEKNKENGVVQYICKDSNDNYYIIKEKSTMNCEFILDTYTLDLPEFLTKYDSADVTTKVALNIEKIKEAINLKDFEYVYNKTDDTFKTNKFKNFDEFENYLKSNLFEQNTFKYKSIEEKAGVYVATVVVTDKENTNSETKAMQVIMKLLNTTDYIISFSFE